MTKSNRKAPRQARAEHTVACILAATCELLNSLGPDGYRKLTTSAVARRAGVSIGTLYQYFPNKEALLAEVLDSLFRKDTELAVTVFERGLEDGLSLREIFGGIARAILEERYQPNPGLYRVAATKSVALIRKETSFPLQTQLIERIQRAIDRHPDAAELPNSRFFGFLFVRGFVDIMRSVHILRPEYIRDPGFVEAFADFLTASFQRPALADFQTSPSTKAVGDDARDHLALS